MYPLIEIAAALLAILWYQQLGLSLLLVSRLLFGFALLVLFVIDLRERILPNVITVPGILVGFAFSLFVPADQFLAPPTSPPGSSRSSAFSRAAASCTSLPKRGGAFDTKRRWDSATSRCWR